MPISLPPPIDAYFAADGAGDADAVVRCFAMDGVVRDEGHSHAGHGAIRDWKRSASTTYAYTVELVDVADEGDQTVVTGRVTGPFPGSPILLHYRFDLAGSLIAALEIRP